MEKLCKVIMILLLCFFTASVSAQKNKNEMVTISATMYDELRDDAKVLTDNVKSLTDSCASLNTVILNLQKRNTELVDVIENKNGDLEGKDSIIGQKEALITILQQQHKTDSMLVAANTKRIADMQKLVDETSAKYANGRLYFKYDEVRIGKCIDDYNKINTSSVKELFKQLPDLLKNYKTISTQIKALLESAQNDPDRKVRNKADEYKLKYSSKIRNLFYYSHYYAKQKSGVWSIPYLDNIIEVSLSILKKHDPGHNDPVNFNSLIDML